MNLQEATTNELMSELEARGYRIDLLWCRQDVVQNLEWINEDREDQDKLPDLSEADQDEILDALPLEYYTQRINEDIAAAIQDYVGLPGE